jgi:osmoprotectant transport system ATP-binding protein
MIKVEDLTKNYGETKAVRGISLEVGEGEFCVLIGPSGCGKSTTLRMINRLIEPTKGDVFIDGKNIRDMDPEILRRSIGYVIQSIGLFPHMTVLENICVVPKLLKWDKEKMKERGRELLKLFGLEPASYENKYPIELSGGEAQRVGVARALAGDPKILLMDEPFGALDPITREKLQIEFSRIQRELKKTIVFVTHDIDEAIRLASRIVLMKDGKIVQSDTPEKILSDPANRFVTEFIGADRALKRLSRFYVKDYMKEAETVTIEDSLEEAKKILNSSETPSLWVLKNGKPAGWLDKKDLEKSENGDMDSAMVPFLCREFCLHSDSTLKEALSKMMWQGVKRVPVVDEKNQILGEVRMEDISSI